MRILFISERQVEEDRYRNYLSSLAEKDSIFFIYNFENAISYIKDRLIAKQEQIDLIIIKDSRDNSFSNKIRRFLISDSDLTYSNRNFNLKSVCVYVLERQYETTNSALRDYDYIYNQNTENYFADEHYIVETIKDWRRKVLDELGDLGVKFNSGFIDYGELFSKGFNKARDTTILSNSFILFPRKLNYYWLNENASQIEQAIHEFLKLMKQDHRKSKKQEEKKYHKFFNKHRYFLERDRYSKTWYESKFKIDESHHFDPDFTLRTNLNYTTDLSMVEVKLPNEGFLKQKTFHQNFYSKIFDHLSQVNDYVEYMQDKQNRSAINHQLGFIPKRVDYNILIGRKEDKEENLYQYNKKMRQFNIYDINLMTYDELLNYQVHFMERMKLLEIR
jgi:hypothetical protein